MTSTTSTNGRLGNQIIRNLATSFIAEKNNLYVSYSSHTSIENLGIQLFVGTRKFNSQILLTDDNYFDILSKPVETNLNPNQAYFQTKKIMDIIYKHLHQESVKNLIISKNPFKERYTRNNDVYIHVRLGDAAIYNPGIYYYKKALSMITFTNIYISTDDSKHEIIRELMRCYPSSILVHRDECATIQFASTCKHLILSNGSFSAMIGYLAFYSTIYYPEYDLNKCWHGDMFSISTWNKISTREK